MVRPQGSLMLAFVASYPSPAIIADPLPPIVEIIPVTRLILRTRLFPLSVKYR